jgi:hypothetical protein
MTIRPLTVPDRENSGPLSEMVHVTELGAEPFVALTVTGGWPSNVMVRSNTLGTKIPVPPESNVR